MAPSAPTDWLTAYAASLEGKAPAAVRADLLSLTMWKIQVILTPHLPRRAPRCTDQPPPPRASVPPGRLWADLRRTICPEAPPFWYNGKHNEKPHTLYGQRADYGWVSITQRTDHCDLSLSQLGMRLLHHLLKESLPIPVGLIVLDFDIL